MNHTAATSAMTPRAAPTPIPAPAPAERPEDDGAGASGDGDPDADDDGDGDGVDDVVPEVVPEGWPGLGAATAARLVILKMLVAESVTMVPPTHTSMANWLENPRSLVATTIHRKKVCES